MVAREGGLRPPSLEGPLLGPLILELVPKLSLWRMGASVRAPGRPTELSVWRMKESSYYWKAVYFGLGDAW